MLVDDVQPVQPPELLAEWRALVGLERVHDLADVIAQPAPDGRLPGPAPHPAPRARGRLVRIGNCVFWLGVPPLSSTSWVAR